MLLKPIVKNDKVLSNNKVIMNSTTPGYQNQPK